MYRADWSFGHTGGNAKWVATVLPTFVWLLLHCHSTVFPKSRLEVPGLVKRAFPICSKMYLEMNWKDTLPSIPERQGYRMTISRFVYSLPVWKRLYGIGTGDRTTMMTMTMTMGVRHTCGKPVPTGNRVDRWRNSCKSLLYFVVRVRCCRYESSRALSHLLTEFLV